VGVASIAPGTCIFCRYPNSNLVSPSVVLELVQIFVQWKSLQGQIKHQMEKQNIIKLTMFFTTTTPGMLPLFYELIFETVYGFLRDDVAATTANLTMRPGR